MTGYRVLQASMVLVAFSVCVMSAAPARAVPTNLAPSGTASSSTIGFGAVAADGNDGNRDGAFGNGSVFHTADPDTAAFWQVDLGTDQYIDRVQIFPRTDAAQGSVENFKIEVFNANDTLVFTKNFLGGGSTNDTVWGTSELRNAFGSRVRISRLDGNPDFMTFAEFEVYGQSTPIAPNIALGKTVTASDGGGFGATPLDAIDGDIDGNYSHIDATGVGSTHPIYHNNAASGGFWQLDLGKTEDLDYLNLFNRTDFAGNSPVASLQVLAEDGVTVEFSTTIDWFGTDLGGRRFDQVIDFTDVSGRFIRIADVSGTNFLTFAEVEVFAVQTVPEPASLTLLALGGLALLRRRRERA